MRITEFSQKRLSALGLLRLLGMAGACAVAGTTPVLAGEGQPSPWEMGMQTPATDVGVFMTNFHTWLVWLTSAIVVLVLALLVYVVFRFNHKANPTPAKTTHNAILEVAWTILPVLILVAIAVPSFRLLRYQLVQPVADMTIKATGHAWYWSYEYPKEQAGGFGFDSNILDEQARAKAIAEGRKPEEAPRLLAVDNEVVLPVGKIIHVQITGADVIHNFALPSLGMKMDAIPGRLNETWFKAEREGIFYGQCSRLCGQNHAFMPIAFRIVSQERYAAWLEDAKKKYASVEGSVSVAAAESLPSQ